MSGGRSPKRGDAFLHKRVLQQDLRSPMPYVVTRVACGWVYYRPESGGGCERCPVEDFYSKVSL